VSRPDPIAEFVRAFETAKDRMEDPYEATATVLATADAEGRPSARMVLLKAVDERGFVFYTNYESRKAEHLEANPRAALTWYWPPLDLQVRAEGPVSRVSEEESDAYFATRARGSQLAAWASHQSHPLSSRAKLVARVAKTEARFLGREVPRPPFWGGYRLSPERMEFWHNRLHRLHDRKLYLWDPDAEDDGWTVQRLYP
jgi:pyridoxamine 5'-phosphate oxidase